MTLKELKEVVDRNYEQYKDRADEIIAVIKTEDSSMGGYACTKVKAIYKGFDWDSWKLGIYTEESLVKQTNEKQLDISKKESAFNKDLINTLTKYQPERNSKLILEVFNCLKRHYTKK